MTGLGAAPTAKHFASQFRQGGQQCWLGEQPLFVFLNDLFACAISADDEWVAPFARSTDVHVVRVAFAVNDLGHGVSPLRGSCSAGLIDCGCSISSFDTAAGLLDLILLSRF